MTLIAPPTRAAQRIAASQSSREMTHQGPRLPGEHWRNHQEFRNIVWIAGYPRSGATLLRMILANCFGLHTSTQYWEDWLAPGYLKAIKAVNNPEEAAIAAKQRVFPVKTHSPTPKIDFPAIVIVRDPRSVAESVWAFYNTGMNPVNLSIEEVITDMPQWGSWSDWIMRWMDSPVVRVVVRYEALVNDLPVQLARLGVALGMPVLSDELPAFDCLRHIEPRLFRRGKAVHTLSPEHEALVWEHHGVMMERLGYQRDGIKATCV